MTNHYAGNPSLPPEVRDRVMSTFMQARDLFKQGRTDEAIAGCELILKMDALFDPAKKLIEKAHNPASPIDIDTLLPAPSASIGDAQMAFAGRDFQSALDSCNAILAADPSNEDALRIGEEARERLEAGPFVEQFIAKARSQFEAGNVSAAKATLEKARALDATHPRIEALARELSPAPAPGGFDFSPTTAETAAGSTDFAAAFGSPSAGSFDFAAPPPASPLAVPEVPVEPEPAQDFEVAPPASSFVVESQPAASDAAASDFGFTFEEDQRAEAAPPSTFSFDTPSEQPAAFSFDAAPKASGLGVGEAQTFDFAAAAVEVSADDQTRIEKYLADGDFSFNEGDYASAIDIWSRIFLIDVTNEQASERIERARKLRGDADRKIEELMAGASAAFQKRDFALARSRVDEALQLDSRNEDAKALLEKLTAAQADYMATAMSMPKQPSADLFDDFAPPPVAAEDVYEEESEAGPRPAAKMKPAGKPVAAKSGLPMVPLAIAAAALIVLTAGGWFVWTKMFSGSKSDPAASAASITSAQALASKGQFNDAIKLLSTITPDDPQHSRALALIAEFKGKLEQTGLVEGRPANQVFAERLANARTAYEAHDYTAAKGWFEKAAEIKPVPPEFKTMVETSTSQVSQLQNAVNLLKEGNFQQAIANADTLLQQNPDNKNALSILADAHFNLGAQALQDERLKDAIAEFDQVLQIQPDDELAKRSRELAARYENQQPDLLFRIYAKHLPLRNRT
ncbi:MAG: tetratricopeptide repeat protein [Thermoanaerobaculia bacterium]